MEEILHQLIGSLSHYLQGFIHPRWCRISSINSSSGRFVWTKFLSWQSLQRYQWRFFNDPERAHQTDLTAFLGGIPKFRADFIWAKWRKCTNSLIQSRNWSCVSVWCCGWDYFNPKINKKILTRWFKVTFLFPIWRSRFAIEKGSLFEGSPAELPGKAGFQNGAWKAKISRSLFERFLNSWAVLSDEQMSN